LKNSCQPEILLYWGGPSSTGKFSYNPYTNKREKGSSKSQLQLSTSGRYEVIRKLFLPQTFAY